MRAVSVQPDRHIAIMTKNLETVGEIVFDQPSLDLNRYRFSVLIPSAILVI
jgi:hypothetical protein